jgi:hypothetical protein
VSQTDSSELRCKHLNPLKSVSVNRSVGLPSDGREPSERTGS